MPEHQKLAQSGELLVAAWVLLIGCLPATSPGRHAELETQAYLLEASVQTEAIEQPLIPALKWELKARLDLVYTRTFRDQSIGSLLSIHQVESQLQEEQAAFVTVPSRLEGLLVELRSFDRGEVLALAGADAGTGWQGHLELLDMLWFALVPRVEGGQGRLELLTSWPVAESRWFGREGLQGSGTTMGGKPLQLELAGSLTSRNSPATRAGSLEGRLELDQKEKRVVGASLLAKRKVEVGCLKLAQQQTVSLKLTHLGAGPPIPIVPFIEVDEVVSDSLKVELQDGRKLEPAYTSVSCTSLFPFLLTPDHWTLEQLQKRVGA